MIRALTITALLAFASVTSPFAQAWEQVASIPGLGRHHPVTFTLDGYGYVATGSTTGAAYTDDFYRYDPIADSWEVLPDFPGPDRSYAYGGSYGGKAYLGFGLGTAFLGDLWEYDPVSEQWTQLAPLPGSPRTHPAFVITDDGKIFVGTGGGPGGNLRDWWEYDIASNIWTQRPDLPGANRHHPYYFNIGDVPYVGFGHGAAIYKDVYRYNRNNTWTRMTDFPSQGRVAGTQFTWDNNGYILSGEGENHQWLPTGELWEYHADDDTWTQLTPHPGTGRWAPGTFLIGNVLYLMAGETAAGMQRDMWSFPLTRAADVEDPIALDNSASLAVYPNPVVGERTWRLGAGSMAEIAGVRLLAPDGRQIEELAFRSGAIEIPRHLASGRYFLAVSLKDGGRRASPVTVLR